MTGSPKVCVNSFIYSFYSFHFIHFISFIHSFIHSFIDSLIHSFISFHLFIHFPLSPTQQWPTLARRDSATTLAAAVIQLRSRPLQVTLAVSPAVEGVTTAATTTTTTTGVKAKTTLHAGQSRTCSADTRRRSARWPGPRPRCWRTSRMALRATSTGVCVCVCMCVCVCVCVFVFVLCNVCVL